jgi:DNA-binding MarR family transcriptional regulator
MIDFQEINTLRQAAREVVRELGLLGDAYFDIGVTLAERHLLIEISQTLYPDVKEIASRLLLDKSTASRLIARAAKKGFLEYCEDKTDKRRKCVQLTKKGKETLNAFEALAETQTKKALDALTPREADLVMKGVELYALGLKRSRLSEEYVVCKMKKEDEIPFIQNFKEYVSLEEIESIVHKIHEKKIDYFLLKKGSKIYGGAGISVVENNKKPSAIVHLLLTKEAERLDLKYFLVKYLE